MNAVLKEPTTGDLRGRLRTDVPMARHTVWGIGGRAARCYEPADADDLATFLVALPRGEPITWLGLGSNVLVRDGGIRGTVVLVGAGLGRLESLDASTVRAEAGVPCPKVARYAVRNALAGCEFFAGVPGTVGGALAMNAGAFGGETWDIVRGVETIDRSGSCHRHHPDAFRVGYRQVEGPPHEWFIAAEFALQPDRAGTAAANLQALLRRRAETQPMGRRSCGSVFRNPPEDFAARLIDASGLKGTRVGGAMVSTKHANFIINTGAASAADVEQLMERIVDRVARDSGIRLQPEVRVVGDPLDGTGAVR